jgi:lysophospholipid acyltransferase (LPLAT)-like uncharacterized protein
MALRVDTIPFWLKTFYLLWAYLTAGLSYGLIILWRLTLRFRWEDAALMEQSPNNIYCIWHKNLILSFMLPFNKPATRKDVWMNHPAWFMKPIHIILYWKGVHKLMLGSSGNSGREAKAAVEEYLRQGYSTCMAVDGPAGPRLQMKHGAMQMALETGVPIICLEYIAHRKPLILAFTWDKKVLSLPFTKVTVKVKGPYYVTKQNYAEVAKLVEAGM